MSKKTTPKKINPVSTIPIHDSVLFNTFPTIEKELIYKSAEESDLNKKQIFWTFVVEIDGPYKRPEPGKPEIRKVYHLTNIETARVVAKMLIQCGHKVNILRSTHIIENIDLATDSGVPPFINLQKDEENNEEEEQEEEPEKQVVQEAPKKSPKKKQSPQ